MTLLTRYSVDTELLEELRSRVYEYAYSHCDEIDITDVRNRIPENIVEVDQNAAIPDLMLKRFLLYAVPQFNIDAALQKFIDFFRFRTKYGIVKLNNKNTICREVWQLKLFTDEGVNRKGQKLVIIRLKYYRKFPQLTYMIKRCILYCVEQYDVMLEKGKIKGLSGLIDLQGFNYFQNINLELVHFCIDMQGYYIGLICSGYIYNLPWALSWLYKMLYSMLCVVMGSDNVRVFLLDKDNIDEYIEESQRPDFLAGKMQLVGSVPQESLPFLKLVDELKNEKIYIEEKNVLKMYSFLQDSLMSM